MSIIALPLIILLAGLLSGVRAAAIFTFLSELVVIIGYYLDFVRGVLSRPITVDDAFGLLMAVTGVGLTGLLLRYALQSLNEAVERARRNERIQAEANRELQEIRSSLEERVAERTQDAERRAVQLQAVVEVSQAATSTLDPERLMWDVSQLIQDRLRLYHVGLFLLDPMGLWAEYQAGSGETGRRLAEQRFRLDLVGGTMVGWCTIHGEPRVSQDVLTEIGRQDHPLLLETRSEAAIPLVARGEVIGALSAQSDQLGTFDPDTMATLRTMADQVAVSIDNARLFAESQEALETARRAYGEMSRQAWTELLGGRADWGYRYSRQSLAASAKDWQPELVQALQKEATVQVEDDGEKALAVPLRVRDQVIGALSFARPGEEGAWTADETTLLQTLVDQLGVALESAQLFEETQQRAARDRLLGEISARIRETLDMDTILQTAVREIGESLGVAEVEVRLGQGLDPDSLSQASGNGGGEGEAIGS